MDATIYREKCKRAEVSSDATSIENRTWGEVAGEVRGGFAATVGERVSKPRTGKPDQPTFFQGELSPKHRKASEGRLKLKR